ncbi:uncharacterized protein [Phaseolus vulgaris]|uniref:uncharacterized protein n=1 Tax=Phaseolus vulgaris TaxID=3885 RepID=UPI0035CBF206
MATPIFDGDNYQMWVVGMETYLEALDLWEAVEEDYEIQSLLENPTSAKAIWDYLKVEYEGDERIRGMQALNLIREFELQRMKESKSVKEYSDKLLSIANKVRLLVFVLKDSRIMEKLLVTVPERFEATIYNNLGEYKGPIKNFSRRALKYFTSTRTKESHETRWRNKGRNYSPCKHCNKLGHRPFFKCWRRPNAKCNQLGHEAVICRNQSEKQDVDAQIANKEEDVLFHATSFCSNISSASWLIDGGCTNHMTHDT